MKVPTVDLKDCVDCDACIEMCPQVFRRNDLGTIEVLDLSEYPENAVDEVIKNCPCDCISWQEA
jgi:ferredoxin